MRHGGELFHAAKHYNIPIEKWLDLSTGISPLSYPVPDIEKDHFTRLPDPLALRQLESAARHCYKVPEGAGLIAGPGTEMIIQFLPYLFKPRSRVCIFSPTYESYKDAFSLAGHFVVPVSSISEIELADVVIVVNPNNPDGRRFSVNELNTMADILDQRDGFLIIDEAYGELTPANSFIPHVERDRVMVLRSIGKFYGLAGVRLGFAIGLGHILEPLKNRLGAWPVSGPTIEIGKTLLVDEGWAKKSRKEIQKGAKKFQKLLKRQGLKRIGGTDLFHLMLVKDGEKLYHQLASEGILTRYFPKRNNWIRFGLCLEKQQLDRLQATLENIDLIDRTAA